MDYHRIQTWYLFQLMGLRFVVVKWKAFVDETWVYDPKVH